MELGQREVEIANDLIVRDKDHLKQDGTEANPNSKEDDEIVVRGTKPLSDIYERCNTTLLEPVNYSQVAFFDHWKTL